MKLSIIVTLKRGDQFRQDAFNNLMKCIEAQTMKDFELIIVEDTGAQKTMSVERISNHYTKLIPLTDIQNRPFNKSWCINVGARAAKSDNLLILDADVLFGKEYFDKIYDFAQECPCFFHCYSWIVLLPGRDNPVCRVSAHKNIHSTGGAWFVNKTFFFEKLGGMNENYFGYGREDSDLWVRVVYCLSSAASELDYALTHQYHHWEVVSAKDNAPYQKNCKLWDYTKNNTKEVIEKLKNSKLGDLKQPTLIEVNI